MTQANDDPAATLLRLTDGYRLSQAIYAAATLKVADLVSGEPRSAAELADTLAVSEDGLYRLLRVLATVEIFREVEGRRFVASPMSELLKSDHPGSMRGWAAFIGRPQHWSLSGDLLHSVQTGEDAAHHLHGASIWELRAGEPGEATVFNEAMAALWRGVLKAILEAYDFNRFTRIVDIGGADGRLMVALLTQHRRPRGVVFDLPKTVAEARAVIEEAGLSGRCETAHGSYYDGVPAGGDAYILKSVLHDCSDEQSREILRNIRQAMAPGGCVLIIEGIMLPASSTPRDALSDLNMLIITGGRERELEEWRTLLGSAGFTLTGTTPTTSRFHIIEARPATG